MTQACQGSPPEAGEALTRPEGVGIFHEVESAMAKGRLPVGAPGRLLPVAVAWRVAHSR